ncbi:hypothetical protein [Roseivirga sp. E12]|uniref:hypothetical protein n=1 Tax=Roseivirga sp. E12 TaxID=2819237 RepID=UPI001ABC2954|nr:hypothetical protein [Roseivirga sp. E12]MBO3698756.1 hypothetical protein [Roseivirga sp. E12]
MANSFNNLRVGKKFRLLNFGESFDFEVLEIMSDGDCQLKDIYTLENYSLYDLIRYGKGPDFDVNDL